MSSPFARLNPNNPMNGYDFTQLRSLMNAGRNPMAMLESMAAQNPAMQPVMQALRSGMSPQQVFQSLCQQRGINPQEFLRQLTGNNGF